MAKLKAFEFVENAVKSREVGRSSGRFIACALLPSPHRSFTSVCAVLAMVALVGCAALPGGGLTPEAAKAVKEEAVAARSKAYWKALIDQDYEAAYAFLSPSSRDVIPFARYKLQMESGDVVRRAASVEKVECEEAACKATTTVTFDHPLVKGVTARNEETWIIVSGQAWLVRKL